MGRSSRRGFTLIEMAVTIAIIAVLSALAFDAMRRARPRATFDGLSAELQSLVHAARQQALAQGVPVAVLVFPDYRGRKSQGRFIVLQEDPAASFFATASALNFDNYDPAVLAAPLGGQVVTTLDLPDDVNVGPLTGLGVANLPFPYNSITTNQACSFCNTAGNHRGAIVFDARGHATFYRAAGTTSGDANGASFSIYGLGLVTGTTFTTSTLVITTGTGSVRTFRNG